MNISYRRRRIIGDIATQFVVLVVGLILFFPFIVMILTAFQSDGEVMQGAAVLIPENWLFSNFRTAMSMGNWTRYFYNSLVITVLVAAMALFFNSLAGFAFARLNFWFRTVLFYCAMIGMMLPMQVLMIPVFLQIMEFPFAGGNNIFGQGGSGLINHHLGVVLPLAAHPFGVFLFRNFFIGFPRELDEAAKMDGCTAFQTYLRIYLPLSKAIFATLLILNSVNSWNQYTWPLLVFNDTNMRTVQLALAVFQGEFSTAWNYLMAATILINLPILILFVFLQKYFVQGIVTTGLKD